jgi:hypothetical protein
MIGSVRDFIYGVNHTSDALADFTVVIVEPELYNAILCRLEHVGRLFLRSYRQSYMVEELRQS